MKVVGIFARTVFGVIGSGNKLPWPHQLKADMEHFKEKTMGHPIIMGRKTWESLPKKPLEGRLNIVISRELQRKNLDTNGVVYFGSFIEAYDWLKMRQFETVFVIGGATLFSTAAKYIDEWYVTVVPYVNLVDNPVHSDVNWLSAKPGVVKVDEQYYYTVEPSDGINWIVIEHYSTKPGYVDGLLDKLKRLWSRL